MAVRSPMSLASKKQLAQTLSAQSQSGAQSSAATPTKTPTNKTTPTPTPASKTNNPLSSSPSSSTTAASPHRHAPRQKASDCCEDEKYPMTPPPSASTTDLKKSASVDPAKSTPPRAALQRSPSSPQPRSAGSSTAKRDLSADAVRVSRPYRLRASDALFSDAYDVNELDVHPAHRTVNKGLNAKKNAHDSDGECETIDDEDDGDDDDDNDNGHHHHEARSFLSNLRDGAPAELRQRLVHANSDRNRNSCADPSTTVSPRGPVKDADAAVKLGAKVRAKSASHRVWSDLETLVVGLLTFVSVLSRCIYISRSNRVVWDEAHFGKFASHYITRTFYTDVHPPLGKSLLGFSGWIAAYNGTFEFKSGESYPPELNYGIMRLFCGFWGALMVPLAYLSCRNLGLSRWSSFTASFFVLCDNAFTVISRFILLDSLLLFCTALGFFCWSAFFRLENSDKHRGSLKWWLSLLATGFSLGLVSSVKWVGFFLVAFVGLHTIENLWDLFGDLKMSIKTYAYHWFARIFCLIIIPISVYVASFYIHFSILVNSGPGDSQMSSLFQANLNNSFLQKLPLEIAYGSRMTFRSNGYGGGILHSHVQTYPHGSKQQQITCYHHRDSNNEWILDMPRKSDGTYDPIPTTPRLIRNGDLVRLVHRVTGRNLHSHPLAAPITKRHNEVSGYGNDTVGDLHDNWYVEIVSDIRRKESEIRRRDATIHTLLTRIRLRHQVTGCLLSTEQKSLPQWGFKQHEVFCNKDRKSKSANYSRSNIWNVEEHWNEKLPLAETSLFKTSFLDDFINVNAGMWVSNSALVPDPDKEPDGLVSQPHEWPLLSRTLRMCSWGDKDIKFMMIGNPMVWWLAAGSLFFYVSLYAFYKLVQQRRLTKPWHPLQWRYFTSIGRCFLTAWILHYVPFMLMGRVLYLHHYFPALYFGILNVGFILDHLLRNRNSAVRHVVYFLLNAGACATFLHFSPLTYGYEKPSKDLKASREWIEEWNISG